MIKKLKIKKNGLGFTLIELVVTVAIFSIIILIGSGIFVSAIKNQKRALAYQQLLDQTSYSVEYMNRALRMATKDLEGSCLGDGYNGYNYITINEGKGIRFINHLEEDDDCQEFYLSDITLTHRVDADGAYSDLPLTSENLKVTSLKFVLQGESQDDDFQPRVTLLMEVKDRNQDIKVKIQTSVSQRALDISY